MEARKKKAEDEGKEEKSRGWRQGRKEHDYYLNISDKKCHNLKRATEKRQAKTNVW